MPDDRMFHKRLGHSEKVTSLTDFEDIVWRQYILSADDFGVMRFSAITIQADNDRLAKKPAKTVQRALEQVRDAGLIHTFAHQGRVYCCQTDWQNHQRVKHPRQTINPQPPAELLEKCSAATRALFTFWPGKKREKLEDDFGNVSETFGDLARARPRVTANTNTAAMTTGERLEAETEEQTPQKRAGAFCQWYEDTHQRLFDVGYMGTRNDYETALRLVAKFSDQDLRDAALVWFGQDDDFATKGTRTIAKFASRASGCLQTARAVVGRSA